MGILEWADRKIKAQNVWDIGILKIFCTIAGMILGAYISAFVIQYLWWFVIVGIVLFIFLMIRFLKA